MNMESELSVELRREWIAKEYLNGRQPQMLWKEYQSKYGLTKHSFDKDITYARSQLSVSVKESFDQIVDDQFTMLGSIIEKHNSSGDTRTVLSAMKQVADLLKLVNPNKGAGKQVNVNFNTQNNNVQLPTMSVDEIKELLGKGGKQVINLDENQDE